VLFLTRQAKYVLRNLEASLCDTCYSEKAILKRGKGKGKAVPLQAWSGSEGYRKLRFPDFMTTAQDGGKVSLTHWPPLPPRKYNWYSFLLEAESTPGP